MNADIRGSVLGRLLFFRSAYIRVSSAAKYFLNQSDHSVDFSWQLDYRTAPIWSNWSPRASEERFLLTSLGVGRLETARAAGLLSSLTGTGNLSRFRRFLRHL